MFIDWCWKTKKVGWVFESIMVGVKIRVMFIGDV